MKVLRAAALITCVVVHAALALTQSASQSALTQPGTSQPDQRAHAASLMADGQRLFLQHTPSGLREGLARYQQALLAWQALGDTSQQVAALLAMATGNFFLHELSQSASLLTQAEDVASASGQREDQGSVLAAFALLHEATGEHGKGRDEARAAGALFQSLDRHNAEAFVRMTEGRIDMDLHDTPAAVSAFERALALFRTAGIAQGETLALLAAGQANLILNQPEAFEKAADDLAQAVARFEAASNSVNLPGALYGLATAEDRLGRIQQARDTYARALPLFAKPGDQPMRGRMLRSLALDEQKLGNFVQARDDYQQALPLFEAPGDEVSRALTLMGLGDVRDELADADGALAAYADAAGAWRSLKDSASEATADLKIGNVHAAAKAWQPALDAYGEAQRIAEDAGDRASQATALIAIAGVYQKQADYRHTREAASQAAALLIDDAQAQQRSVALLVAGDAAARLHEYPAALQDLDQVIALGAQNPGGKAGALAAEAEIYTDTGEQKKAVDLLIQAGDIDRSMHNDRAANKVRLDLGLAYATLGRMDEALATDEEALTAARASGDLQQQAATLGNLAQLHQAFGDTRQAIDLYLQSIEAARKAGDRDVEGITLSNLGMAYHALADDAKAVDSLDRALAIAKQLDNKHEQAISLNNLALIDNDTGEPQRALDTYDQVRSLFTAIADHSNEAITLSNIGSIYSGLGADDRAHSYFQQALEIDQRIGDDEGCAVTLNNMAVLAQEDGEQREALRLFGQSLAIAEKLGNRTAQANLLSSMGAVNSQLGDHDQAKQQLTRAQAIARETGNVGVETVALHNLAIDHEQTGDLQKAADLLEQALAMWRQIRSVAGQASALVVLARIETRQGALNEALGHVDQAIRLSESQRSRVASEDLRAALLARSGGAYAEKIAVLMALDEQHPGQGFAARAFETSEQARARSLLDLLLQSHADIRRGVDPARLAEERSVEHAMSAKAIQRQKLSATGPDAAAAAQLDHDIDELVAAHEKIEQEIRAASPVYAALTQPEPLSLTDVQRLLEHGTLLLEYALGDEHSERGYVWAVGANAMHAYPLPPRAMVVQAIRAFQNALPDVANPRDFDAASAKLGAMLLGSVAGELGSNRLIVVGDGPLQAVPFAALMVPAGPRKGPRMLVLDHEIVQEPSASAIAALRRSTAGRGSPPDTVAVLADPVFSASDPRLAGTEPRSDQLSANVVAVVSRAVTNNGELPRLQNTRAEASSILALASPARSLARFDFDASKQAAEDPGLARYRIVHFATHGLLDDRNPGLSGLVFSLFKPDGTPEDGYLRLNDVFDLNLPVDLVVLSACNSGQGKLVGGEGLVGLTRGFFYAGAASLVASLWNVDDAATAWLMARFYGEMLGRDHLAPAAALRRAQLAMLQSGRWRQPYYWAPFIAEGEWRGWSRTSVAQRPPT